MTDAWATDGPAQDTLDFAAAAILGPRADDEAWKAHWASLPNHRSPQVMHPLLTRDDVTGRLGEIACPALVIHGDLDASIPVAKAEELVAGLPGAVPLALIAGAGHAANLTFPAETNAAISDFLATLP